MDSKVSVLKIDPRHFPQTGLFEVWLFLLGPINITKGPIAERSKPSDLDCGRGPGFKSWRGVEIFYPLLEWDKKQQQPAKCNLER